MNAKIIEDFSGRIPQDPISRLDFALRCVYTRLTNPNMAVSLTSILLTIMGSLYYEVSSYIVLADGFEVDDDEIRTANAIVAGVVRKTVEEVGQLAKRISKSAVVNIGGIDYIRNIVPSDSYTG